MTNSEREKIIKILRKERPNDDDFNMWLEPKKGKELQWAVDEVIKFLEQSSWRPVNKENPKKDGFYITTCDGEICGEDKPFTGLSEFENGKWLDDEEDYQCVLAWQPLPEPYKENNCDNCGKCGKKQCSGPLCFGNKYCDWQEPSDSSDDEWGDFPNPDNI